MKTLLRQTLTGLYFQAPGKWTEDLSRAYDFRFIDRALQYVEIWELKGVEIAFAFDRPQSITTVSLEKISVQYASI